MKERLDYWRSQFVATISTETVRIGRMTSSKEFSIAGDNGLSFTNLRTDSFISTFGKRDAKHHNAEFVREGVFNYREGTTTRRSWMREAAS